MKKADIIKQANKGQNLVWDLVSILEQEGKIEKTTKIRKPAIYISEKQQLIDLSETETLIIERESAAGAIVNYRLITYDLVSGTVKGAYNPFGK
ncbi:hypothetical protein SAMN05216392_0754 [Streptococcus equinus]|uniref:Uncharacterized protein n=1 Tax=Streptococcus equinus TaxID=1335 RepID=A0A1H0YMG1_STREI|nr:hypothetical protein [Streptococcus equinus]QBX15752.1 hypothetical protein Javan213_0004 [Streptococcus phage Javan213]SDQ16382.1 hypothetical protein SAMN05216392_0754 [Streptococcus equinus]